MVRDKVYVQGPEFHHLHCLSTKCQLVLLEVPQHHRPDLSGLSSIELLAGTLN